MVLTSLILSTIVQTATIDPEAAKLFAWFDSLGAAPDLSKPYVLVVDDNQVQAKGFLIGEHESFFDIRTISQGIQTFYKKDPPPNERTYRYVKADLKEALKQIARTQDGSQLGRISLYMDVNISPPAALAWTCHRLGLEAESAALIKQDKKELLNSYTYVNGKYVPITLPDWQYVERAKETVIEPMMHIEVSHFRSMKLTWSDLQQRFEALDKKFGDTKKGKDFGILARAIKRNIDEAKIYQPDLSTRKGHIADLIWQLRSERDSSQESRGPAYEKLCDLGLVAVPQLLDALHDDHITRSLAYQFSGPPIRHCNQTVFRVKDVAGDVLALIARRYFYGKTSRVSEVDARKWYRDLMAGGEKQMLIKRTQSEERDACSCALVLAEKYPDAALEPIIAGYKKTQALPDLRDFIDALGKLPPAKTEPFLREILSTSKDVLPRTTAIKVLAATKPDEAADLAKSEWSRYYSERMNTYGFEDLATLMVRFRRSDLVDLMATNLDKQSTYWRACVAVGFELASKEPPLGSPAPSVAYKIAAEDLLAHELDDNNACEDYWNTKGIDFDKKKVSRFALHALHTVMPNVYSYGETKSPEEEERQRQSALATYRSRRGS